MEAEGALKLCSSSSVDGTILAFTIAGVGFGGDRAADDDVAAFIGEFWSDPTPDGAPLPAGLGSSRSREQSMYEASTLRTAKATSSSKTMRMSMLRLNACQHDV